MGSSTDPMVRKSWISGSGKVKRNGTSSAGFVRKLGQIKRFQDENGHILVTFNCDKDVACKPLTAL
jgi:hypothetical protein